MTRKKTFQPIHPLAMAEAITEINIRAGYLLAEIQTVSDLMEHMDHDQLKAHVTKVALSANDLRDIMYSDE
jgi:hypothetical protein